MFSNIPPGQHTLGRSIHPGFYVPLWHHDRETFSVEPSAENRFRLILVNQGTGILQFAECRQTFIAPALFCLDERDRVRLEQSRDLHAQALYFFPSIVNCLFNFENIREKREHFVGTAFQDLELLEALIQRTENYKGQLRLDATSARRIATLFNAVQQELQQQNSMYWPCRSRSFLLEILIFVFRIFSAPPDKKLDSTGDGLLTVSDGIDPVILYLHTHYHEKLTVEMLSNMFYTNRTTLEERFHLATGASIMTYLIQLRIRVAATLLHDTTIPVFEIARRVGFNDSTHFGRMFRKVLGCSPSDYRQRLCWVTL
jgi:AraC family L-rhamnose operon regulatory protein RhaS